MDDFINRQSFSPGHQWFSFVFVAIRINSPLPRPSTIKPFNGHLIGFPSPPVLLQSGVIFDGGVPLALPLDTPIYKKRTLIRFNNNNCKCTCMTLFKLWLCILSVMKWTLHASLLSDSVLRLNHYSVINITIITKSHFKFHWSQRCRCYVHLITNLKTS